MNLLRLGTLLFAVSFSLIAEPQPYTTHFRVTVDHIPVGKMVRTLEKLSDGSYRLNNRMFTTGFIANFRDDSMDETSHWNYSAQQVEPQNYSYHKKGGKREKIEQARFLWDEKRVVLSYRGTPLTLELEGGEFDRLSYQWQLRQDLKTGKKRMEYRVVDGDELKTYTFTVVGEERLKIGSKKVATVAVERIADNGRETRFWCAIDHDYLLVKIMQDDGSHLFVGEVEAL
ncbi:MAG: DUF3108 domain-containing protein [Gammaproteobacteria bacterium]|nr:DUF3108 domain-containing protein [Gammaproteobacteria bacterium]